MLGPNSYFRDEFRRNIELAPQVPHLISFNNLPVEILMGDAFGKQLLFRRMREGKMTQIMTQRRQPQNQPPMSSKKHKSPTSTLPVLSQEAAVAKTPLRPSSIKRIDQSGKSFPPISVPLAQLTNI
jgi:hypothetical protein